MRILHVLSTAVLLCACASPPGEGVPTPVDRSPAPVPADPRGELRVEIHTPDPDHVLTGWESWIEVEGGASVFGGVRQLDLVFVLDTSKSLKRTDPRNYRSRGAVGLVRSLSERSDIQIAVVDFDSQGELVLALTPDRTGAVQALRGLNRQGRTNLAAGIRTALTELERNARTGSSRVILLFTDGKSDAEEAQRATAEARRRGVAVHTLLLGSDRRGQAILQEIASGTGASFVRVTDPSKLPEAFLNLRTTGVERVTLRINGSPPIPTRLAGGTFAARVPLVPGENRILASATSLDGEAAEDAVTVRVTGPLAVRLDLPEEPVLPYLEAEWTVEGTVDPFVDLPEEFRLDSALWGVERVVLRVNGVGPIPAVVVGGRFQGTVPLREGENRIEAYATTVDGRRSGDVLTVLMQAAGCAELQVEALRDGAPALSISDRAVEIVFDASNSMWGRLAGKPKIGIAKEILTDALDWLPRDLDLSLRVYGHRHPREARNCADSELLVPIGAGDRARIREAIAGVGPKGQTPLAYSLRQVGEDFGSYSGERAVVLLTDGIESCGGDPAAEARALHEEAGVAVHVIGFGLGTGPDEDPESLRAIAEAGHGRFLTARTADELRGALAVTVGTPFEVRNREGVVAVGALGSGEPIHLPEGEYRVRIESKPPHEVPLRLERERGLTLVLERTEGGVSHSVRSHPADYTPCSTEASTFDPNRIPREVLDPPTARYEIE